MTNQNIYEGVSPAVGIQKPTEAVLVSGIDGNLGAYIQVTLTAARVVGLPTNRIPGRRYIFNFIQGGAGGWAVTWNAAYKLIWSDAGNWAATRSSIAFIDDGTNLNQDGGQTPYSPSLPVGVASSRFQRVGRIYNASATLIDIAPEPNPAGATPAGQWAVETADSLYVATYPSNPISLAGTTAPLRNGTQLRISSMPVDLSAYVNQVVVITGTHPPEVLGDHTVAVPVAAGTVNAGTCTDVAVTVAGAVWASVYGSYTGVVAQPLTAIVAGIMWNAWVSAANTVTVRFCNPTAGNIVVGTNNFDFWLVR